MNLIIATVLSLIIQTNAGPTSKLEWTQPGADVATAQGYSYKYYLDANQGLGFGQVTCVVGNTTTDSICTAPFPAVTPGNHTIKISASNAAGESGQSDVVSFTFLAVPNKPAGLKIVNVSGN